MLAGKAVELEVVVVVHPEIERPSKNRDE